MGIIPYEIIMAPLPDDKSSCEGCLVHNPAGEHIHCSATGDCVCTVYAMPRLAHKVSGVVLTDQDLIQSYLNHKKEFGLWVSLPMKSK